MSYLDHFDLAGSSKDLPGGRRPDHDVVMFGAWTMHVVVFLTMLGDGYPAREALAVTVALGVSCAKMIGRRSDDDDHG